MCHPYIESAMALSNIERDGYEHEAIQNPISENNVGTLKAPQKRPLQSTLTSVRYSDTVLALTSAVLVTVVAQKSTILAIWSQSIAHTAKRMTP